ncbi:5',5'''-P-1,P-4-tetraphosphate phosphorylase 2 [Grifola frondosa]|uniref:5',5'''-P-1,P-4-tetraphosphate phosphorylase 2 n=1 Tax=Grifola frondosa TaxID=5627 RepID=A0A1C7M3S8_GRIFR|nr:5',5'''-P-1,P-4-tetraphosphate phosphorylase 2 [Grifola frondosa]
MTAHSEIISKLSAGFDRALQSGDLFFFPSTVHGHVEHGVEFQIRLCPALQSKPRLPTPHFSEEDAEEAAEAAAKAKEDPFAPPYIPNLLPLPHHILVVTKDYQSQTSPLLPPDLVQTYSLLFAAQKTGRQFFAFYNCGDLSGASQPHKHLQLIPVEDDGPPVERLARAANLEVPDRPFSLTTLPYANHIRRLPTMLASASPSELERTLSHAFLTLLDLAISTIRHDDGYPAGSPSYNVVLTLQHMHLIPRRQETHVLQETGEDLSVNALGFAGLLLVKSERELEAVKKEGVGKILRGMSEVVIHESFGLFALFMVDGSS